MTEVIKMFNESPMGRFRHAIPNLFTLIGYFVSLPVSVTKSLLGIYDDSACEMSSYSKLWLAFITELLRRTHSQKSEIYKDEKTTLSLLNMLLHGQGDKTSEYKCSDGGQIFHSLGYVSWMLASNKNRNDDFAIPKYDPFKEVKVPEIVIQQSAIFEKSMEIWARTQYRAIEVKNHSEEIANATKLVEEWCTDIQKNTGFIFKKDNSSEINTSVKAPPWSQDSDSDSFHENTSLNHVREEVKRKAEQFDSKAINSSIFEVTAKLLSQLSSHVYPPLSSLPGCLGFLHHYLSNNLRYEEIDAAGGLPPQHWIDGIKQTVGHVFKKIAEFQTECEKSHSGHGEDYGKDANLEPYRDTQNNTMRNEQENDDVSDDEDTIKEYLKAIHRTKDQRIVTIPMLLSVIGIDIGDLPMQLIRAMLCQAVSYPSNTQARDATLSGELVDLAFNRGGYVHNYLCSVEAKLVSYRETAVRNTAQMAVWEIGNQCMLQTESLWAFIGYLKKTHKDRGGEGFSSLMKSIMSCSDVHKFPLLTYKIRVILLGTYQNIVVFARGNVWIPGKKKSRKLETILGKEVWEDIITELRANVKIHIYRESGIPNRQGHCNSNPYIPNQVREILGMLPIDEQLRCQNKKQKN